MKRARLDKTHTPMSCRISKDDSNKDEIEKKNDTVLSKGTRYMFQEFKTYESKEFALSQKSQLEIYLEEPRSDIGEDLDVLSFWKAHQYRHPELA